MGAVFKLGTIKMKTFIEIGSCDFNTLNNLSDAGWRGLIVDPMKKYLDRLERKPRIAYVNYAVSDNPGEIKFYEFIDEAVEKDHDFAGMSTIHPIKENLHLMKELTVKAITYSNLIKTYQVDRVDFLKIDTEGHDLIILKTVIFEGSVRPKLIKVEHAHCNDIEMKAFLESKGYYVEVEARDIWAVDLK